MRLVICESSTVVRKTICVLNKTNLPPKIIRTIQSYQFCVPDIHVMIRIKHQNTCTPEANINGDTPTVISCEDRRPMNMSKNPIITMNLKSTYQYIALAGISR